MHGGHLAVGGHSLSAVSPHQWLTLSVVVRHWRSRRLFTPVPAVIFFLLFDSPVRAHRPTTTTPSLGKPPPALALLLFINLNPFKHPEKSSIFLGTRFIPLSLKGEGEELTYLTSFATIVL
jgi:hypothetical protein